MLWRLSSGTEIIIHSGAVDKKCYSFVNNSYAPRFGGMERAISPWKSMEEITLK